MDRTEQQEKKEPFDEWLDYAFHVVLAVDLKFPREMSAVKGVIIEKALKPYHFWLEEKGISPPVIRMLLPLSGPRGLFSFY